MEASSPSNLQVLGGPMKITVTQKNKGDARRGYHDTDTTVEFEYDGSSWLTTEREKQIVDVIIGGTRMWFRFIHEEDIKKETTYESPFSKSTITGNIKVGSKYIVNHGYDSGD
jgi:hypothetical protein